MGSCLFRGALLAVICVGSTALAHFEPAKTYALLVGVLEWEDTTFSPFPKPGRQDRQLEATLLQRGVPPSQIVFLEDKAATLARLRAEVTTWAKRAPQDATLLFYYAGHGTEGPGGKPVYLANYDIRGTQLPATGFTAAELASVIRAEFRGRNVLFFGDHCYSGIDGELASRFPGSWGVGALSSTDRTNVSTPEWTFTQALNAVFQGKAVVDRNDDRKVTFAEAAAYIEQQMEYLEDQPSGSGHSAAFSPDYVFSEVPREEKPIPRFHGYRLFDYVEVLDGKKWYIARLTAYADGLFTAEWLSGGTPVKVPPSAVRAISAAKTAAAP